MADKSAFGKFLDDNTKGGLNKAFLGMSAVEIAQSDNKLKALVKTLVQLVLFKPLIAIGLAGAFAAMGRSIRALVKDTGSLEAALRKLTTIQGLQRSLAPFVGGLQAAKLKVAELVNFAASNNLELGGVGEAELSLQDLTHGAFAGSKALQTISDTAAATNNTLKDTADGVGQFYADLREGQPIARAAERLREMGILSDAGVQKLTALQQSGATNGAVFDALTKSLQANAGAMRGLRDDVASVATAYAAAKAGLQEKFASPFVASDIENTKNWTGALNAIAPVVQQVAPFLEKLTSGFSTLGSWLAKTAAQNPVLAQSLGNLVEVSASLVAAMSAIAGVGLGVWLLGAAGAATAAATALIGFTGATGLAATGIMAMGTAVRVAMIAGGIGAILLVLASAGGIIYNFAQSSNAATKALEDQRKGHEETANAMQKQIAAAQTLRERHEAMAKAIQETADAQAEYNKALDEQASSDAGTMNSVKGKVGDLLNSFDGGKRDWGHDAAAAAKVAEAQRRVEEAKKTERDAKDRFGHDKGYVSPERAGMDREVARAKAELAHNREGVVRLENLDTFSGHYERLRAQYGDKDAKDKALTLASGDIQGRAASVAADHLAKIGLGGEFGGGGDVQKQIRDLTKDIAGYLRNIDAKTGGNDGPDNAVQTDTDY